MGAGDSNSCPHTCTAGALSTPKPCGIDTRVPEGQLGVCSTNSTGITSTIYLWHPSVAGQSHLTQWHHSQRGPACLSSDPFAWLCSTFLPGAVTNIMSKSNSGEERAYLAYTSRSQSATEGSQVRNSGQEQLTKVVYKLGLQFVLS